MSAGLLLLVLMLWLTLIFKVLMWLLTLGLSIMLADCRFVIVGLNVVVDVDLQSVDVVVDCGAKHFAQCLPVYFMLTQQQHGGGVVVCVDFNMPFCCVTKHDV